MKRHTPFLWVALAAPLLVAATQACGSSSSDAPAEEAGGATGEGAGDGDGDTVGFDGVPPEDCVVSRADPPRGACEPWFVLRSDTALSADENFRVRFITAGDLNGDGRADVVMAEPFQILENKGELEFERVNAQSDVRSTTTTVALADLDNDGDLDLVTLDQDWIEVYRNTGEFEFELMFETTGSESIATHVLFVDMNADGFLDVFVVYPPKAEQGRPEVPPVLLQNEGGDSFSSVGDSFFAGFETYAWSSSLLGKDADELSEVFVAADGGIEDFGFEARDSWNRSENRNRLFLVSEDPCLGAGGCGANNLPLGEGLHVREGADEFELAGPHSSMGGVVEDFDQNGQFDLFIPDYGRNKLYLGDGGQFVESAVEAGLGASHRINDECDEDTDSADCLLVSWGTLYEDFNLDGEPELLIFNHNETGIFEQPPQLYVKSSHSPLQFEERALGLGDIAATAAIPSDFDLDGDLDVLVTTHRGAPLLLENKAGEQSDHRMLTVRLDGTQSNRPGVGAVLQLEFDGAPAQRRVMAPGGVSRASLPPLVHFGIGDEEPTRLRVIWPSGTTTDVTELGEPVITVSE